MLDQNAIVVWACDDHIHVPERQGGQVDTRRRHAKGVVQLDIFGGDGATKPDSAIGGGSR